MTTHPVIAELRRKKVSEVEADIKEADSVVSTAVFYIGLFHQLVPFNQQRDLCETPASLCCNRC